ncbi:hypothetical protein [uncultured Polaribacter sp.]|uniref:hypothetical protein n=1 Tax=uncultured Polaribacter sp. TaxID=174711 RepID=UPI002611DCA5|nr:hypothetical protein [uncultured Polaribacter sp.]
MKNGLYIVLIIFSSYLFVSCTGEVKTHTIKSPTLKLIAAGPMFEGSNTATVTWSYKLEKLVPKFTKEIQIEDFRISSITIKPIKDADYPEIGKIVMELKPGNQGMSRVGLLEGNFDKNKLNELTIATNQEDFKEGFTEERLTFVVDFDLKVEEFFDDIKFELDLTFEVKTKI